MATDMSDRQTNMDDRLYMLFNSLAQALTAAYAQNEPAEAAVADGSGLSFKSSVTTLGQLFFCKLEVSACDNLVYTFMCIPKPQPMQTAAAVATNVPVTLQAQGMTIPKGAEVREVVVKMSDHRSKQLGSATVCLLSDTDRTVFYPNPLISVVSFFLANCMCMD
jgi:hypothetical protein